MHLSPHPKHTLMLSRPALLLVLAMLVLPSLVHATNSQCSGLYRNKQYVLAADCFLKAAGKIQSTQKSAALLRYRKGRYLRNAAICLGNAAKKSQEPTKSAYWRERAVSLLDQYLKEKLYEIPIRATQARALRKRFFQAIKYGQVSINTRKAKEICLRGYQAHVCAKKKRWQGSLRPGRWTLTVRFPNGASVRRSISLKPGGSERLSFKQPIARVAVQFATGSPSARIYLRGVGLGSEKKKIGARWKLSLLPGVYIVRVFYKSKRAWVLRFVLKRQTPRSFSWKPTKPGILLTSTPPGAQIRLGGIAQGQTPLQLLLQKGKSTVEAKSPCYLREKRTISFPTSPKKLRISQRPGALIQSNLAYKGLVSSQRALGLAAVLAGGAVLLFGATGQIIASALHSDAQAAQDAFKREPIQATADKYEALANSGNTWRTIGAVGLGVGALGVGLGILRLATLPQAPSTPKTCSFE